MDQEERQHLRELRHIHLQRLRSLELRVAREGSNTPPEVSLELYELQHHILDIERQLSSPTAVEKVPPTSLIDEEERQHLETLLIANMRRLRTLEVQQAMMGFSVDSFVLNEIDDIKATIASIEEQLSAGSETKSVSQPLEKEESGLTSSWKHALEVQRSAKYHLTSEISNFVINLCRTLDFIIVKESYYIHHGHCVACLVKTPMLHLNLPDEFPLILILQEDVSDNFVRHLEDVPKMMGSAATFGLILAPDSHRRVQQQIDRLIRPAMKTDLIVLGQGFLDEISTSSVPKNVLLREILRKVDLMSISPFMAGGADLLDRMFFGREGELKNIAESITKTSVSITCGRRMGKTTLLKRLARVVLPARKHACFFLDCQPVSDYRDLFGEMAVQWGRAHLPFDPERPNSFSHVVAALTGPDKRPPIFLLDEVDALLSYDQKRDQRLFRQLRALSQSGRAHFIMTGERSVQAQLRNADSPLFNFFGLKLKLSFLDWASVNKLVIEPLNDMQIELDDPLIVNTIFNATSGHPYLVQRLCQEVVRTISRRRGRIVKPEDVEQVLDSSEYQDDYFETVWGQAPQLARIITMLIDSHGATLTQVLERLGQYGLKPDPLDVEAALDLLDLYSVLLRKGGRYSFVATAFPEMLRRTYGDDLELNIALERRRYG